MITPRDLENLLGYLAAREAFTSGDLRVAEALRTMSWPDALNAIHREAKRRTILEVQNSTRRTR